MSYTIEQCCRRPSFPRASNNRCPLPGVCRCSTTKAVDLMRGQTMGKVEGSEVAIP